MIFFVQVLVFLSVFFYRKYYLLKRLFDLKAMENCLVYNFFSQRENFDYALLSVNDFDFGIGS